MLGVVVVVVLATAVMKGGGDLIFIVVVHWMTRTRFVARCPSHLSRSQSCRLNHRHLSHLL